VFVGRLGVWGRNVGAKKKQGKGKGTAKKAAKQRAPAKPKKPADMVQARSNISNLVRKASDEIAKEMIETAKKGELARAKYLFELAGLYPPNEETAPKTEAESLAQIVIKGLGGPVEPEVVEEEEAEAESASAQEAEQADGAEDCGSSGSDSVADHDAQ